MLHGRAAERAAIATLVDEAWASRGGALVLRGLPGVGKSALLADAVDRAEGMRVLRTQGVESESPLAFAALHRLLRPVTSALGQLPARQARALRAAFGEEEGDVDTDRFVVFLGALSLLAEAAEDAPVLAVVDDAHWLDDASAAALLFVARRVQAERIALLFAAREGDLRIFDGGDLPELAVGGLDREAAATLLAERAGVEVPPAVGAELVARTGGNPLALVELPGALSAAELAGDTPLPAQLPVTEGVERVFLDRARRLPEQAQSMLLVMAADDSGRLSTVRRAATVLGVDETALDAVERSGLVHVRGGELELRHPLVRSAVYNAATSSRRRRVHAAIAEAMSAAQDLERRVWHRAAAAEDPDEDVAAALEAVAERAGQRGGQEAASAAAERAAELSPSPGNRARRRYAAARAAWLGGLPVRARGLVDAALAEAEEPGLRADAARLRARIEWNIGSIQLGHRMVLRAAREIAPVDRERAREMAMFGAAIAAFGGESGIDVSPAALVPPAAATDPPRVRCFDALLRGLELAHRQEWAGAAPLLREAFALADVLHPDDQDLLPNLGIAATHLGDDAASLRFHDALLARARDTGAVIMVLYGLTRRVPAELATGRWTAARAGMSEALQLAEATGLPGLTSAPLAYQALLAVLSGERAWGDVAAHAEQVAAAEPLGILELLVRDLLRWTAALGADGPAAALGRIEQLSLPVSRGLAAIDRLELAARADRPDLVRGWAAELESFGAVTDQAWAGAAAAHGHGLLGGDAAEQHFSRALELHAASPRRFNAARTRLAFGEHLRRARRRVAAREHLRAALDTFDELGARPWAERARQELRASGETARRRDGGATAELTAQELQVAQLVAQGLPNRDVAGRLFVSPRTVDFHLRNVFSKLGISSRTELARARLG